MEFYAHIINYNGVWLRVSRDGRVWSCDRIVEQGDQTNLYRSREYKQGAIGQLGYKSVVISYLGKRYAFLVHRLVATAFIPNPHNYPCVNHKDNNPLNNCVENLEWCTVQYNAEYSAKQGRFNGNGEQRQVICVETGEVYRSITYAAKQLKLKVGSAWGALKKGYQCKGFHFKYI